MSWTELPADVASYLRNVRVKNVGEKDAVFYFNSIPYIVRVGEETTMPFEAVCVYCGDPRATANPQVIPTNGEPMYVPARNDEVHRLRQLYGMHALGGDQDIICGTDPETGADIDYPRVEVTQAAGERLYTVLEDPTGELANPGILSPVQQRANNDQRAIIERMEEEIRMLKERQARDDAGLTPPGHAPYEPLTEADLPRDEAPDPTAAPLPNRGTPSDKLDLPIRQKIANKLKSEDG